MKHSESKKRAILRDAMKPELHAPAVAARHGVSYSYVNNLRNAEMARLKAEGLPIPTRCPCGKAVWHPGHCAVPASTVAQCRKLLLTGMMTKEVARIACLSKRVVDSIVLAMSPEERAIRKPLAAGNATRAQVAARARAARYREGKRSMEANRHLLTEWHRSDSDVAAEIGVTRQAIGAARRTLIAEMKAQGQSFPPRPKSQAPAGSVSGPRRRVDVKAIVAHVGTGLSQPEIAKLLGCPLNHVSRVFDTLPLRVRENHARMAQSASLRRFAAPMAKDDRLVQLRASVRRGVPSEIADDVSQELYAVMLSEGLDVEQTIRRCASVLTLQRRLSGDSSDTLSLDAKVGHDAKVTFVDFLRDQSAEDEFDAVLDRIDRERALYGRRIAV